MVRQEFVEVDGNQMEMLVAEPEGDGPHPAVVIAMHLPAHMGLKEDAFTIDLCERHAAAGFAVAVPYVFHRIPLELDMQQKRGELHDDLLMVDLSAAYAHLEALESVDNDRIGVLGHCLGGRIAWVAACRDSRYKVMLDFWGGNIKDGWGQGSPAALDLIDGLGCPVAGFFGNDDPNPSPEDVNDTEEALKANGNEYEFHRYDDAGHAFMDFTREERFSENATRDAWEKSIAFLDKHLK